MGRTHLGSGMVKGIGPLERTLARGDLVRETIGEEELIFLPHLKRAEEVIAARIKNLCTAGANYPAIDVEKVVAWCQQKTDKELAPSQKEAVKQALTSRALIITGGAGVGKTTLVNAILLILRAKKVRCLLCAPTGRAAKRLLETTGLEAKTIHRMLEVNPAMGGLEVSPKRGYRRGLGRKQTAVIQEPRGRI